MRVLRIETLSQSVVLHLHTEREGVNAYTLASMLVSIADAAKAANSAINPGYEVEIVVEGIGPGSFRAKISAAYKSSRNLLSSQVLIGIAIGVVANFIYERTLAVDDDVKIEIHTEEVIIQRGDERIVVPRNVYDATREAEKSESFKQSVGKALKSIASDDAIEGIGFVERMDSPPPEVLIPRARIAAAIGRLEEDAPDRMVNEIVDVQIFKAILAKSTRKWEFVWRGVKISAPILHDEFYARFFAHQITIAPGDVLTVRLVIHQARDPVTGIYSNTAYEIAEVLDHKPRFKQMQLSVDGAAS